LPFFADATAVFFSFVLTGTFRIFPAVTWPSLFIPLAARSDFGETPNFFEMEAAVSPGFTLYLTIFVLRSRSGGAGGFDSRIWSATSAYCCPMPWGIFRS